MKVSTQGQVLLIHMSVAIRGNSYNACSAEHIVPRLVPSGFLPHHHAAEQTLSICLLPRSEPLGTGDDAGIDFRTSYQSFQSGSTSSAI